MTLISSSGRRTFSFALTAAFLAASVPPVAAQTPNAPGLLGEEPGFDHLVVVASKRERHLRDVAADVTVITDADLRATLATSLADAFRYLPGVTYDGAGVRFGTESIVLRGIGGNRVAIELDGVPLSEQFDVGRFSNATRDLADTALVGQLEVLRGPASALYGSSALGGVVAMRTPDPRRLVSDGRVGGFGAAAYRSLDDSVHAQGRLAFQGEHASALVAVSGRKGNQVESAAVGDAEDWQDYRRNSLLLKVVAPEDSAHDWRVAAIHQDNQSDTGIYSILGSGRFRSTTRLEGDDRSEATLLSAEYRFPGRGALLDSGVLRTFFAETDVHQHTVDERGAARTPVMINRDFFYEQKLHGAELNLWHESEIAGWDHQVGVGFEWIERRTKELRNGLSRDLATGATSSDILGESFPLRDFPVSRSRELGAYVSDRLSRGPLSLLMALRFDENRLMPRADSVFLEDNPATEVVALSDSDLSPKLGVVYRLRDDVDAYVQYAHGFRAPPFEDANIGLDIPLFNIRAIPNPDLRSETSKGVELGLRWHGQNTELQLSAFRTDYRDFIETKVRIGVDPLSGRLLFQSQNVSQARIEGVEARVLHRLAAPLDGLTLHAAGYWADSENRNDGAPLASVGPAEAVLGATWRTRDDRTEVRALVTVSESGNAWCRSRRNAVRSPMGTRSLMSL